MQFEGYFIKFYSRQIFRPYGTIVISQYLQCAISVYCQHFATYNNIACAILLQYHHAAATTGLQAQSKTK